MLLGQHKVGVFQNKLNCTTLGNCVFCYIFKQSHFSQAYILETSERSTSMVTGAGTVPPVCPVAKGIRVYVRL